MIISKYNILTGIDAMIKRHMKIIEQYIDTESVNLTEEENSVFLSSLRAVYIYQETIKHINS